MNLTPEHIGILKGATVTAALFSAGILIGLFFLRRKHEEALNKLESDTARFCLDMAAEHYEGVILRREKKLRQDLSTKNEQPDLDSDDFQKEMDAMNNYEEPDGDWKAMHEEMDCHMEEYKALAKQISQKDAECQEHLKRLASNNLITSASPDEAETGTGNR